MEIDHIRGYLGKVSNSVYMECGRWVCYNPNIKLHQGYKIIFSAFFESQGTKYRIGGNSQTWEIKHFQPLDKFTFSCCEKSSTEIRRQPQICKKELLFDSNFNERIVDSSQWKREHFIPDEANFEFCSYQNSDENSYIGGGHLFISAKPFRNEEDVLGTLNLTIGCTRDSLKECTMTSDRGFILPPVVSARMKNKINFKYGTISIRARLPMGDWLYPEVYLESDKPPFRRIWIAYARGNKRLITKERLELGRNMLFGGPVLDILEPERSQYLSYTKTESHGQFHTYQVVWEPTKITLWFDNQVYGKYGNDISSQFNDPMHLVLGVGVGGIADFPDGSITTDNTTKPWENFERLQFKKFFKARDNWLSTWDVGRSYMEVDFVRIWAL
ncbi:hypothetical protein HHI36_022429 [Cryptolaemus montrouzieri]